MRILVTGATGLVGCAIAERLHLAGHQVISLARLRSAALARDMRQIAAEIASSELLDTIQRQVEPCEVIVHAAADRNPCISAPWTSRTNCEGTHRILELASRWKSKILIHTSGVAVIGQPARTPVTEKHPCLPANPYLAGKLYSEHLTNMVQGWGGRGISLRITAPIGPRMPSGRIVPQFLLSAAKGIPLRVNGTGSRRQDYVDVRDIASAVLLCLDREASGTFNIGSGKSISNIDLARLCIEMSRSSSSLEFTGVPDPDDQVNWDVSIDKARQELGYVPQTPLEQSLSYIAAALSSNPVERIISGGQTGVDRAALDVAFEIAIPCGGWCPNGRIAEDGPIAERYPLQETPSDDYAQRTEWNVRDSDGTLVLSLGEPSGGTAHTIEIARSLAKPCLVLDLAGPPDPETARDWLRRYGIRTLNVAGPRASASPRIYLLAQSFLRAVVARH